MKIIDAFPFFDELDLLEIRLNTLDSHVDLFVLSEFTTSFAGNLKPLYFDENKSRFTKFLPKIVHLKNVQSEILNPFENDRYQKDSLREPLMALGQKEDLLLFGDVDEIPRPAAIGKFIETLSQGVNFAHFAQDLFYSYLNLQETSGHLLSYAGEYDNVKDKKWLGTVGTTFDFLNEGSMTSLRDPERKAGAYRLGDGGWHFSYAGGASKPPMVRVRDKILNGPHQEFNNEKVFDKLQSRMEQNEDLFGRTFKTSRFSRIKRPKFEVVPIDSSFPFFILRHQEELKHLIRDSH
jgi:beta-1,4-mannosyl-glycoprotein beta-1,4-N-acetylglucosaminyltransferase